MLIGLIEYEGNMVTEESLQMVTFGLNVAETSGDEFVALLIGAKETAALGEILGKYGVSKVLKVTGDKLGELVNQAYASVISQAAGHEKCDVIIFANNFSGKALAPRVSVKLNAGVGSGVTGVPSSLDPFTVPKKVFTGKAYAHVVIKSPVRILTLAQNSFGIIESVVETTIAI